MFVNMHTLPAGQSMYTVAVAPAGQDPKGPGFSYDEVDFVASSRATTETVLQTGIAAMKKGYDGSAVYGLIDQSWGEVLFQAETAEEARS